MTEPAPSSGEDEELARVAALIEIDRAADALPRLRARLASSPDDADAWWLLVLALLGVGDADAAVESARCLVRLRPDDEHALLALVAASRAAGHHHEARDVAQEAVLVAPDSWAAHVQLAGVLLVDDQPPGAGRRGARRRRRDGEGSRQRALELAPDRPEVHVLDAQVALEQGRPGRARAAVHRALALDPAQVDALWLLTVLDALRGDLGSTVRGIGSVVRAAPREAVPEVVLEVLTMRWLQALHVGSFALLLVTRAGDDGRVGLQPWWVAAAALALVALGVGTRYAFGRVGSSVPPLLRTTWSRSVPVVLWTGLVLVAATGALLRCLTPSPDVRAVAGGIAVLALLLGVLASGSGVRSMKRRAESAPSRWSHDADDLKLSG